MGWQGRWQAGWQAIRRALLAANCVRAALTEATSGKTVTTVDTTPYGCSIKY